MSARTDAASAADRRRVQRAALRAGLWVGLASAAVVTVCTVATVVALLATSRPDRPPPGRGRGERIVDLDVAIPFAVGVGALGVVALGLIAWYASRRVAQPLADALAVQRSFVADASHELRTPLTTLSSRIQLAQHRAQTGGDVDAVLADLRRDAAVMDAVLNDLLASAESAGAAPADTPARADAVDVAHEAMALLRPRADARGIRLVVDAPAQVKAAADPVALLRAISALLDNALRYAPDGSVIRVDVRGVRNHVEIRVADQGPGITGVDPERIFERFARADGAPAEPGARGHGLGLALVRDIAVRFHGTVEVEQTSPSGATFLLTLPAFRR